MKTINPHSIEIRQLAETDLPDLIDLWNNDPEGYNEHFIPFKMNYDTLKGVLNKAVMDIFLAVAVNGNLAGFFMLRGFDAGYEIPGYGVWISSKFSNKGLAKLTLQYSISLCRIAEIKKLMLKVHPDNQVALKMYKNFGFTEAGIDEKIGHTIMFKDLT